jgi:hypothetical protein
MRRRLLAISAALPSSELIPYILPSLRAEPAVANLAANALAAASGKDFRLDGAGAPRPLADIVRDYEEAFAAQKAKTRPRP